MTFKTLVSRFFGERSGDSHSQKSVGNIKEKTTDRKSAKIANKNFQTHGSWCTCCCCSLSIIAQCLFARVKQKFNIGNEKDSSVSSTKHSSEQDNSNSTVKESSDRDSPISTINERNQRDSSIYTINESINQNNAVSIVSESSDKVSSVVTVNEKGERNSPISVITKSSDEYVGDDSEVQSEAREDRCSWMSKTDKTGLVNLGNTCFMNSVLQALFMLTTFRSSVLSLNSENDSSLMKALQDLFSALASSQRQPYIPIQFLMASLPPWLEPGSQQDCSEYLRFLLNSLHSEERSMRDLRELEASGISVDRSHSPGARCGKKKTLIENIFGGKMKTDIRCETCRHISHRSEVFTDLPLAFPPSHAKDPAQGMEKRSVSELIKRFLAPEILDGDNQYQCQKCGSLKKAVKTIRIVEEPEHLILTLLRFSYDQENHEMKKILDPVSIPTSLELPVEKSTKHGLSAKLRVQRQIRYALNSVVVHCGTTSESGHYYSYARDIPPVQGAGEKKNTSPSGHEASEEGMEWMQFNDSSVTFTSERSVLNAGISQRETAYVLIYKKLGCENTNARPGSSRKTKQRMGFPYRRGVKYHKHTAEKTPK